MRSQRMFSLGHMHSVILQIQTTLTNSQRKASQTLCFLLDPLHAQGFQDLFPHPRFLLTWLTTSLPYRPSPWLFLTTLYHPVMLLFIKNLQTSHLHVIVGKLSSHTITVCSTTQEEDTQTGGKEDEEVGHVNVEPPSCFQLDVNSQF